MYMVALNKNKSYTAESQTKEQIVNGLKAIDPTVEVTFRASRQCTEFDLVLIDGRAVARAYHKQSEQIAFLMRLGKL